MVSLAHKRMGVMVISVMANGRKAFIKTTLQQKSFLSLRSLRSFAARSSDFGLWVRAVD
jgi:hypothetical protein